MEEIIRYIAKDSPVSARRVLERLDRTIHLLAENPGFGPLRPELEADVRSFPVWSYVIFYRVRDEGIEVVRVLHGHRDLRVAFDEPRM